VELSHLTIRELRRLIQSREVSAVEVTSYYLAKIEEKDKFFNAFLSVDREGAIRTALKIDQAIKKGKTGGLLCGIPIVVKDILATKRWETTAGSRILKGFIPSYEATAIARLRQQGAVLLGKTNLDEFAMGSSGENSAFGPCCNPWDLERVAGGSSSGSAVAVAGLMCSGALGTDTGGSIRQPAAFCGIVGLKPTYGRVSRYGLIAFASSFDQIGPMARRVEDCAYLLQVIAGYDPLDATCSTEPLKDYISLTRDNLTGIKVGLPKEYWGPGLDKEIREIVSKAIFDIEALGAEVYEISLPHTKYATSVYYLIANSEASSNLARYDGVRYGKRCQRQGKDIWDMYNLTRTQGFGAEVKRRIMLGTYALRSGYYEKYYLKAQKIRTIIQKEFQETFKKVDVILTPTSPSVAFKLGERMNDPLSMCFADVYVCPVNLAGLPAISVPCGFTSQNLPVGLQIIGPLFKEDLILEIASVYESKSKWYKRLFSLNIYKEIKKN
jgi:aspartyl-tRNA(Asn)/glutamyl-tRNA(Gln) amidotransferase subunit A